MVKTNKSVQGVVGGSSKLEWTVKNMQSSVKVYSTRGNVTDHIAAMTFSGFYINPLYANRIKVQSVDWNGDFWIKIKNLMYTDDGTVYIAIVDDVSKVNITLFVTGMCVLC